MSANKSSISQAESYQEIGDYWDEHDLGEVWEQTEAVEFEMDAGLEANYYPVEAALAQKLRTLARQRGISPATLVNLWLQERVTQEAPR